MGRPVGYKLSDEEKQRISAGVKCAWDEGRITRGRAWPIPPQLQAMYDDLKNKLSASEARRLVQAHAAQKGISNGS